MTVAWCARCRNPAPIDPSELVGNGGDPDLMIVLVPPAGWVGDPDDMHGGVLCGSCATSEEIADWMAGLALLEQVRGDL